MQRTIWQRQVREGVYARAQEFIARIELASRRHSGRFPLYAGTSAKVAGNFQESRSFLTGEFC